MSSSIDVAALESEMDRASYQLKRAPHSVQKPGYIPEELNYGVAFQQLVKAGLRTQLKKKYRR